MNDNYYITKKNIGSKQINVMKYESHY